MNIARLKIFSLCISTLCLAVMVLSSGKVTAAEKTATDKTASDKSAKPNVLFIAVDDLNDWIGCLHGHPQVKTPHLDALARRGVVFTNAHCQAPLCNPSRTSIMLGMRPSTTGVYGLAPMFRTVDELKDRVTLPQTFTSAGYFTATTGKIYHGKVGGKNLEAQEFNDWITPTKHTRPAKPFATLPKQHPAMDWGPYPLKDEDHQDYHVADAGISALGKIPADKPFFIAIGFHVPHVPCYAPQKWFDLYPLNELQAPIMLPDDRADTPLFSWFLHWKLPEPRLSVLLSRNEFMPMVRGYLASTSFMDAQVGRVLEALKATGRDDNTIVVVWSDHGWHLGEKEISGKNTLWERSTRVPLIFAGPGIALNKECATPAELLDLYPTLTELCGLKAPADLEGHSLVPQLKDPQTKRPWPAMTSHNQGNHTIRTERWRYIKYADGSEELYDHQTDPNEWHNIAKYEEYQDVIADLSNWLPKIDKAPVPNSAHRILYYDPQTKVANWEGLDIDPDELEK